jgi:hypothetical protein
MYSMWFWMTVDLLFEYTAGSRLRIGGYAPDVA